MSAPLAQVAPEAPVTNRHPLDAVRDHLATYVCTMRDEDLDVLTLWAAHTHLVNETYTTPRLVLDSPVPGSGKTTVLEHLERLCVYPVQMASLSSPALLTRMLDNGMRTILIDEADRSLDPKKDGIADLLAVLNSGYKRGGTRPVLVPTKEGWRVSEMPTFSPVAMAGNNPNLPEDTRTRTIRVLLLPDLEGRVDESDWELIDEDTRRLGDWLAQWADSVRDQVRTERPSMPAGIRGRFRERWLPLKRVAVAAGGRWPDVVDVLALNDLEQLEHDREDGMVRERPAVLLLKHLHALFEQSGEPFIATAQITRHLSETHHDQWGDGSPMGKPITAHRIGRMLAQSYGVNSTRLDRTGPRGYARAAFEPVWRRMGTQPETGASGANGATGAGDVEKVVSGPSCDRDLVGLGNKVSGIGCLDCGFPLPTAAVELGATHHLGCGPEAA